MINFKKSKYLDIIRLIGENYNPIYYSELKEKTGLADSTLSRDLNWLKNIEIENGLKGNEVDAFYLKKNAYIESTGINKSKKNSYKLTTAGEDLFNSLFLEKEEVSLVDLVIQEFKIYEKLWNYVDNNRDLFYNQFHNKFQPWTVQIFEFFEDVNESNITKMLDSFPGDLNQRFYNLFDAITTTVFTHPLWKTNAKSDNLEIPVFNEMHFDLLNESPTFKQKFQLFGFYPEIFCIIKEDKIIKTINSLIERYLKIFYWKGIKYHTHEEIIRKDIVKNVLNDLHVVCPEYSDFINQLHTEITIYIKNIIENLSSNKIQKKKLPFNLLSPQIKEKFEFYLRRKLVLSDPDKVPTQLLKLGATKEIIYEQIEIFKGKSDLEPNNYNLKLKLLELLVDNYSNEFRTDYKFYERFRIGLINYIEELIEELTTSDPEYQESALILGYIFYNQKYQVREKALKISELLLNYYPDKVVLLENLIELNYHQKVWNIKKIKELTSRALELTKNNPFFQFSDFIFKSIQDEENINKNLEGLISKILDFEPIPENVIKSINFFCNLLNKNSLNKLSLKILEKFLKIFDIPELKWIYAENLLGNKEYFRAIQEFLELIDFYPNKIFEGRILALLRFVKLPELNEYKELITFLKNLTKYLNLVSTIYEWHIGKSEIKDFQEKREELLVTLRSELKQIKSSLKNKHSITLPLKIKAIFLKALDREKNLESCLSSILKITPNNIWANTGLALLVFKQGNYEQSFKILNFVEELKEIEHYSISYDFSPFSYLLKENDFNIFKLYIKAGKYHEASLIMEEFLLNQYSQQNINITASKIGKDLIFCYREKTNNIGEVIKKTLKLANKMDATKEEDSNLINIQKDSSYIRQSLIDYLFDEKQYIRCLELILELSKEYTSILEPSTSFFSPFNKNIFYLAECYLKLNNLIKAKEFYEQSFDDLNNDIRFGAIMNLLLIHPLPDNLKINEKQYYLKKIIKGIKKINQLLQKEALIEKLIYKTNIERSIGNISLLIREREKEENNFFKNIRAQLYLISENKRYYYEIVVACACALNGYLDEMNYYVNKEKVIESYPIISTLLKILYCYYENNFDKFNELNIKLHKLVPNSLVPLLLNLHFLRYKKGIYEISKIKNLFKTIWQIENNRSKIYGIEKQILSYFGKNLIWYPYKWVIIYEKYIKSREKSEVQKLLKVLSFIENKHYNQELELLEFITRFLNPDRKLTAYLDLLLISSGYKFPETKYFIYRLLNPEIGQYGIRTYGEIAYQANRLKEFLPIVDEYRKKEINRYKGELGIPDFNRRWLEERFVIFLLKCFKFKGLSKRILKSWNYLEKLKGYPKEKLRYFKILSDMREQHYIGAEIKAYQLIKLFKDDSELKWDDDYFKVWILSKVLSYLNEGKELNPIVILNELDELIDFEGMNIDSIYLHLLILDTLTHELLEGCEIEIFKFAQKLFNQIINSIDWSDKKTHNIIIEKSYFNRYLIINFSLEIVKELDKMIEQLNPGEFNQARKNFLYYIKAMIYFKNNKILEAKNVLDLFINDTNEEELYTTYKDINDLYLEVMRNV